MEGRKDFNFQSLSVNGIPSIVQKSHRTKATLLQPDWKGRGAREKDGSVGKTLYFSCTGPDFGSQRRSQPPVTSAPGDLMPLVFLGELNTSVCNTHIHTNNSLKKKQTHTEVWEVSIT